SRGGRVVAGLPRVVHDEPVPVSRITPSLPMPCHHFSRGISRRDMLRTSAGGFGHLALAAMLGGTTAGKRANASGVGTSAPEMVPVPHFAPRAKRIMFLFMWGGPSHAALFDPKARLQEAAGQPLHGKD